MRNRREVLRLAQEAGVATTKQLKCFDREGRLVALEVDRPLGELVDELRELGVL